MKKLSKFCPEIFKSRLACAFLIAQLVFSVFFLDWDKVILFIKTIDQNQCKPVSDGVPSFGFHCYYAPPNIFEIFEGILALISVPTIITTDFLMKSLKAENPQWCIETFDAIEVLAFLLFNCVYWMFLGYLIEIAHEKYAKNRSVSEKPFSIFSDTD